MTIFIVGLGLIGASYAEGLHQKGHVIFGYDLNEELVKEAISLGFIDQKSSLKMMDTAELVILALYPKDNVSFIKKEGFRLKSGQVLTDVSGTKGWMMEQIEANLPEGVTYTSHHPMAGKETSGFYARYSHLFHRANMMIVPGKRSGKDDLGLITHIANDLKFGKLLVTDAMTHDRLVAFTSQLTHLLAVCLMHADHEKDTKEATGDSFRDLTRIAKINEVMWSELFLENKDLLLSMIESFEGELNRVKEMITSNDQEALMLYLRQAKEKRKAFDIH